ncbi:Mannose-6-phosphate isomerase, class I [Singulisphaera sp. GP187]|uniref:hypothetical protein n=1 Tax=Singulisphaera sp. GP187 TaxID=1882752 RepID=UPI000928B28E|nr:hypothetical protein [Singulisphaera sp. GP187]SIN96636.1 Mannose-6-phosphate isomerase, class I [Singulisphaera sp. GP187]
MSDQQLAARARAALDAGEGILRLAPTWVPRSFLMPGGRLKLAPQDLYALGTHRGGIDERWFASTTPAANEGAPADEGLSYVVHNGDKFTLKDAVGLHGAEMIGSALWDKYKKWPVYSKFFDNLGPIPHHMHQTAEQAALLGREGKPESYYFPPQLNWTGNNFPHTFMGLEPGTTKEDIRRCLERWDEGDNGILDFSKAYRLKPGTGWLIPPAVLHAPGSLVTYEPQWGSDVFGMYQSMVEGRRVPWDLLVKDVPADKHKDLDYLVEQLDWEKNVDPNFKANNYLEPIVHAGSQAEGYVDKWIVYGKVDGKEYFSARELTVYPGQSVTIKDQGASGLVVTQGRGTIGKLDVDCPAYIRYGEVTKDEVFITEKRAKEGVKITNTGTEVFVSLRYFGPGVHPNAPNVGDARKS